MKPILLDLPFPVLTPRLLIRPCAPGDGKGVYEAQLESVGVMRPWMTWAREEMSLEKTEQGCREAHLRFLSREDLRLNLYDRATGEFVGGSGLHRVDWEHRLFEIGYWIRSSRARQGLITEAVNGLTRYAFAALAARRVAIHCNPENLRSKAVPERLGFALEGVHRNADKYSAPEISCRDGAVYARVSPEGLPPLETAWGPAARV